jgi:hypothetical protein
VSGDDRELTSDELDELAAFRERMRNEGRLYFVDEFGRQRGRPPGIRGVTKTEFLTTYRKLRAELDRWPLQRELGVRLNAGKRQVRQWITDFDLVWPPE